MLFSLACDIRRKHKPGAQAPVKVANKREPRARESGAKRGSVHTVARFHGLLVVFRDLILGLAPQALCLRLLSQAEGLFVQSLLKSCIP